MSKLARLSDYVLRQLTNAIIKWQWTSVVYQITNSCAMWGSVMISLDKANSWNIFGQIWYSALISNGFLLSTGMKFDSTYHFESCIMLVIMHSDKIWQENSSKYTNTPYTIQIHHSSICHCGKISAFHHRKVLGSSLYLWFKHLMVCFLLFQKPDHKICDNIKNVAWLHSWFWKICEAKFRKLKIYACKSSQKFGHCKSFMPYWNSYREKLSKIRQI